MATPRYPALYQINTRVWLTELSGQLGRPATLDDVPDAELDRLARAGFDWVWLLSVWQTGPLARDVSRRNAEWRKEFLDTLPDLHEGDIAGSGFAITAYSAHASLGGDSALARLRERLRKRGLRLMLDFVPNHMGLGHPWVETHPEFFVHGTEDDRARAPMNYVRVGNHVLAHGRDPYFPGWPDTLQLDYAREATQDAMRAELLRIADRCDGVRCDMAMLVLPDVFERTWGARAPLFWPTTIARVHERHPGFTFLAEAYWDLEWTLQQQGFDFVYDKRLYDRLRAGVAGPVRDHLRAGLDFQDKLARFMENHDEPRAATVFAPGTYEAALAITYLSPGLRFFHQGQRDGKTKRISPHLVRGPIEPRDARIAQSYERILELLREPIIRDGNWQLLECTPAWDGNWTSDCFVASVWQRAGSDPLVVVVNYAPNHSQCHVRLPLRGLGGRMWMLSDRWGGEAYRWSGDDLAARGLFVDMAPWQVHAFRVREEPLARAPRAADRSAAAAHSP
jgi:hypothetical protein